MKLGGVADRPEGHAAMQREHPEGRSRGNKMKGSERNLKKYEKK